jgi:hypothetical protein
MLWGFCFIAQGLKEGKKILWDTTNLVGVGSAV